MKTTTRIWPVMLTASTLALISACDSQAPEAAPPAQAPVTASPVETMQPGASPTVPQAATAAPSGPAEPLPTISSASSNDGYQEIEWDSLMPAEYHPQVILEKYQKELEELDDSDPRAMQVYGNIQAELDNAPVNPAIDGKKIKLPGFIAPLENDNGQVTEFLLVPYFGACIHVPPPPVNQTVMVTTGPGQAISADQADLAYWVKGVIRTDRESTDLGSAGYRIEQAEIELF
jgi:hypothetical protein